MMPAAADASRRPDAARTAPPLAFAARPPRAKLASCTSRTRPPRRPVVAVLATESGQCDREARFCRREFAPARGGRWSRALRKPPRALSAGTRPGSTPAAPHPTPHRHCAKRAQPAQRRSASTGRERHAGSESERQLPVGNGEKYGLARHVARCVEREFSAGISTRTASSPPFFLHCRISRAARLSETGEGDAPWGRLDAVLVTQVGAEGGKARLQQPQKIRFKRNLFYLLRLVYDFHSKFDL